MREIGMRQLKAKLGETLRTVEDGEQIRVTRRGKPVADIVPASARSSEDKLRALVADGRLSPASRARPHRPPRRLDNGRSASAIVLAERDLER